jgi:hypothetical protein
LKRKRLAKHKGNPYRKLERDNNYHIPVNEAKRTYRRLAEQYIDSERTLTEI